MPSRKPEPGLLLLRPARAVDALAVAARVNAGYQHYVARIGMPPGPMTEDHEQVVRDFQVTVVESGKGIVAVVPEHRGKGLGKRLMELAEREARRQGFDSIYLYTNERMTENLETYRHLGCVEYARRTESGLHRVYMGKQLD